MVAVVIRKPTLYDIPAILTLAMKFNDTYCTTPLHLEKVLLLITYCIEEGVAWISDTGFIGGCVVEDLMRDRTILQEVAWYSEGRDGVALLNAFIDEGKKKGVDELRVCTLEASSAMAGRILQRKGFAPLETSYRLEVGGCPLSLPSSPLPELPPQ